MVLKFTFRNTTNMISNVNEISIPADIPPGKYTCHIGNIEQRIEPVEKGLSQVCEVTLILDKQEDKGPVITRDTFPKNNEIVRSVCKNKGCEIQHAGCTLSNCREYVGD